MWYHHHSLENNHRELRDQCIEYLLSDNKLTLVIDNYPIKSLSWILYPLRGNARSITFDSKNHIYKYVVNNEELNHILKEDIYYKGTVLEKMEAIKGLDPNSTEYMEKYQDIISVEEYKITDIR